MIRYFGVRHFSPACAANVTAFLAEFRPDLVLIEGPADLSGLIPQISSEQVTYPAAILAYTEDSPVCTAIWPFAEFSPELQAMRWAREAGVPAEFIDLPAAVFLAMQESDGRAEQAEMPQRESVYAAIERVTGLPQETFWEYHFEQVADHADFCAAMHEYGASLRQFSEIDGETALREAYMRCRIADAAEKYENIAVITGAFHTAALEGIPASPADRRLTAKRKTVPMHETLMPYSYFRLSSRAGYGAGSSAPAYFEILWNCRLRGQTDGAPTEYLARLAEYQRKTGQAAFTANVIESLRLAETLAAMRGGRYPALTDLHDAAVTCMGEGSFAAISHACADTEIGSRIGRLPDGWVNTSVQQDFLNQLHDLKLERYRTGAAQELELDLRENLRVKSEKSAFLDLNRSNLLHRLRVCGVDFGKQLDRAQDKATWAEKWSLRWEPETEIALVEASLRGDTVAQAAAATLNGRLASAESLPETAAILPEAFLCGLPACVETAAKAVQAMTADCSAAADAGHTLGTLSAAVRYGSIRRIDPAPLLPLLEQLYLKFCLSLHGAALCDNDAAQPLTTACAAAAEAVTAHAQLLDRDLLTAALRAVAEDSAANPLLGGFCTALLLEWGAMPQADFSALMQRRLSYGTAPADAAGWFEGLCRRGRRALITRLSLWEQLCDYLSALGDGEFRKVLVVLRRTFAVFSAGEKADIAENIGEIMGLSGTDAAEVMLGGTAEEAAAFEGLDDFDFDDI